MGCAEAINRKEGGVDNDPSLSDATRAVSRNGFNLQGKSRVVRILVSEAPIAGAGRPSPKRGFHGSNMIIRHQAIPTRSLSQQAA